MSTTPTESGGGEEVGGEDLFAFSTADATNNSESITTVDSSSIPPIVESPAVDLTKDDENEDLEFGFKRPEMYTEKFPKKVDGYDRHVFLAYKTALSWPPRVEDVEYDPLPSKFALALKNRKEAIQKKTRFTVIEGGVEAGFSDGDILIFPEMNKYKNLTHEAVDDFVDDVLVKESTSQALGSPEELTGSYVFVCSHANRDRRCGVCGPILVEKLKEEIALRGLKDQIFVSPCSHVGGHKYAGNVIVFGSNSDKKIRGHWYGYVTPDDVPLLLDNHIGKGEIIDRLWRGEVCNLNQEKIEEPKFKPQESDSVPHQNGTNLESKTEEFQETITKDTMQNGGSCCQGANGFTCCKEDKVDLDVDVSESKPRECSSACARGMGKMSAWMGKLEQSDVLVGVAVIGAVASVAVAYSIYRRSG